MTGGLIAAMWRSYRDPRGAIAIQAQRGFTEPQILVHLLLACGLYFLASLPDAVKSSGALGFEDARTGVISAHLFAYLFVAPLLAYLVAALVHLLARGLGGRGGFLGARAALFWSALLGAPMALVLSLAKLGLDLSAAPRLLPLVSVVALAAFVFWLWLVAANLAEVERFATTYRVAVVLGFVVGGSALVLSLLAGDAVGA